MIEFILLAARTGRSSLLGWPSRQIRPIANQPGDLKGDVLVNDPRFNLPFPGQAMTGDTAGSPGTVAVTLADGKSRTVPLINGDSYQCPWCEAPVLSPQAWQQHEQLRAEDRERDGEPEQPPRPYPADYAAAWAAGGCPSPACLVNMTAEQLAGRRQEEEAAGRHRRVLESAGRQTLARDQERDELWQRLAAEAGEKGACLHCLRRSSWTSGQPKFTRHRTPGFRGSRPAR